MSNFEVYLDVTVGMVGARYVLGSLEDDMSTKTIASEANN